MFITQIFSRLSVRARIVVLGVIPVVGFLANGIAYLTGDVEVGSAFEAVHRNTEVADASRDLKTGLLIMRAATTDFVARPSDDEVKNFSNGQAMAMDSLDRIQASLAAIGPGLGHAAAHHGARSQGQLRQPGRRAENARL